MERNNHNGGGNENLVPHFGNLSVDENNSVSGSPHNMLPSNIPSNQMFGQSSNVRSSSSSCIEQDSPSVRSATGSISSSSDTIGSSSTANVYSSTGHPVYNWQATKTTVKERFAFMFNNEILSDVHFIVGRDMTQQRIPAHKFVLSVGSAVFDAMFNGTLATQSDQIELPDVEPAAFLALLK